MSAAVDIAIEPADSADARACVEHYYAELNQRFDGGFDPGSVAYAGASGADETFVVARIEGKPVGCGMLKAIGQGIGEVKRVWVSSEARGRGVAGGIMDFLEDIARERGHALLRLDTNRSLVEAQAMYLRRGYREIARYNDNPYADHWFEKAL